MKLKGGKFRPFRSLRRAAKKTKKGINKASKAVGKASKNRFVKAARRAADFGLKSVPVVGNVYSVADLGARAARAATRGRLGKFAREEAAAGLLSTVAPQTSAALDAKKAARGVSSALIKGKGKKSRSGKVTTVRPKGSSLPANRQIISKTI